jgi:hypothetical protein
MMKAQCQKCREIVPLEFVVDGAGILVTCPACAERYHDAAGSAAPPPARAATECPKCGLSQPAIPACRRCGLASDRWAAWSRDATPEEDGTWVGVEAAWGDPRAHDAYLIEVQRRGAFGEAAARYRARGDDPVAQTRLRQVRTLAELALSRRIAAPAEPAVRSPARMIALLVAFVVLLVVGVFVLAREAQPPIGGSPSGRLLE